MPRSLPIIVALLAGLTALGAVQLVLQYAAKDDKSPPEVISKRDDHAEFANPDLPIEERVADLLSRMTLEEKLAQLVVKTAAIERLGIPRYDWWNECLHGVVTPGLPATVFPQAIGLASTWNPAIVSEVSRTIAEEARALHHHYARSGFRGRYSGLTMFAPNVNIFRDPRWGRGQETYGEDPYLTSQMGVAFVRGLQGDHPKYFKVIATPKHFAVHSGPELLRRSHDAHISERDLRDTYLPAFRATILAGGAYSIMCAYNSINGQPCCANTWLIENILRKEWGFAGYVVSDCGAIESIHRDHHFVPSAAEGAASAARAGCDLDCSGHNRGLRLALEQGLVTEAEIDEKLKRLFEARFRLGMFDPPDRVPFTQYPLESVNSSENQDLALLSAKESIVLLKNKDEFLPLPKTIASIAVIGPNANSVSALLGNYHGRPRKPITLLEGLRSAVSTSVKIAYAEGCSLVADQGTEKAKIERAIKISRDCEVIIACLGLSADWEGEEDPDIRAPGFEGGDRLVLALPMTQQELLRGLQSTGKPIVLVLFNGGPLAINWAKDHCAAILEVWYPGEQGGTAIADVLFGDYNPAGRLPITFYKSVEDLPPFADYDMAGRTYRYFSGKVLYPFGYGLSYTKFIYDDLTIEPREARSGQDVMVGVTVTNVGSYAGDEVTQLYLTDEAANVRIPIRSLQGFQRVHLEPNENKKLTFTLTPRHMSLLDSENRRVVQPGVFVVSVGGKQPVRCEVGGAVEKRELSSSFTIVGDEFGVNSRP